MTSASSESAVRDLIIVGSGPAGYTAALYAARAELAPLVFEGLQPGGALMTTSEVENFPGFPDGTAGTELMDRQRAQAARFGAELVTEDVDEITLGGPIKVVSAGGVCYRARAIVLAMGSATRYLGVPGEQSLLGKGVSSCATCDGAFFRDQDVAVVGGGDSAMEEATFLTRFARSVTIINRSSRLRASKIMVDRATVNPKIRWIMDSDVLEVHGQAELAEVRLRDRGTGRESGLMVSGMFVAIGHDPRSELVLDELRTDAEGYVLTEEGSTRTGVEGVFAAGDLVDRHYRQAITAAGSGCMAAIDARAMAVGGMTAASEGLRGLIHDGMTIAVGGFGLSGIPVDLIEAVRDSGVRGLTVVSNNMGVDGKGLGLLLENRQVDKVIASYVGENRLFAKQYLSGELDVEFNPQGTLAERLRAGGAGIAAFYTRTGVGTVIAEGKPAAIFDGSVHIQERGIVADLALVYAHTGDRFQNLRYRRAARNFNPVVATSGRVTVAEIGHLVDAIDPDDVHTPGVYVSKIALSSGRPKDIEQRTTRPRSAATVR